VGIEEIIVVVGAAKAERYREFSYVPEDPLKLKREGVVSGILTSVCSLRTTPRVGSPTNLYGWVRMRFLDFHAASNEKPIEGLDAVL
jgi:hypothetical protein